jgi:hypothetical protein
MTAKQNMEKLSSLLTISELEGDAVKVEIYCSVCGLELCYTEYVINNWISVVPLAADPLIGLRSFLFPAVPEKVGRIWKLEYT